MFQVGMSGQNHPEQLSNSILKDCRILISYQKNKANLKPGSILRADGMNIVVNTFWAATSSLPPSFTVAMFNVLRESCLLAESYYRAKYTCSREEKFNWFQVK